MTSPNPFPTPLYFPFTYINDAVAGSLIQSLGRIALLRPSEDALPPDMARWRDRGLEIRVPVSADGDRLAAVVREYRQWAELHEGMDLAALGEMASRGAPDDEPLHGIVSELRRRQGGEVPAPDPDRLFQDRLFLALAQDFDWRQAELTEGLAKAGDSGRRLLAELRGEEDADELAALDLEGIRLPRVPDDPGAHLTRRRLEAWGGLLRESGDFPSILVTDSPAVMDDMREYLRECLGAGSDPLAVADVLPPDLPSPDCHRRLAHIAASSETGTTETVSGETGIQVVRVAGGALSHLKTLFGWKGRETRPSLDDDAVVLLHWVRGQ